MGLWMSSLTINYATLLAMPSISSINKSLGWVKCYINENDFCEFVTSALPRVDVADCFDSDVVLRFYRISSKCVLL